MINCIPNKPAPEYIIFIVVSKMMSALHITALHVWKQNKFHHLKKSNAVKSEEILSEAQVAGGSKRLIAVFPAWGTLCS